MLYQPGDKIHKYVVEKIIGEGGMARVYQARHEVLDIPFALKIPKNLHGSTVDRLTREARVQAKLRHPNIVNVVDLLDLDGLPCLVMEYFNGLTMGQWLEAQKPTIKEVDGIFLQILDAVKEAHTLNVIHRDLKPSNIMIENRLDRIFVKVCDFGVAKALEATEVSFTRTGITLGTPAYMAPEQVRNAKNVDQRADIFSLGALLYELVTSQQAFFGSDTLDLLNAVANNPHIPPQRYVANLPNRIGVAVDGALQKNPELRIPDCNVLREVFVGKKIWSLGKASALNSAEGQEGALIDLNLPISPVDEDDETMLIPRKQPIDELNTQPDSPDSMSNAVIAKIEESQTLEFPSRDITEETADGLEQSSSVVWKPDADLPAMPDAPEVGQVTSDMAAEKEIADTDVNDVQLQARSTKVGLQTIVLTSGFMSFGLVVAAFLIVVGFIALYPSAKEPQENSVQTTVNSNPESTKKDDPVPENKQPSGQDIPVSEPASQPVAVNANTAKPEQDQNAEKKSENSNKPEENKKPKSSKKSDEGKKSEDSKKKKKVRHAVFSYSGADRLRLIGKNGTFSAGKIPPGSYSLQATFGGRKVRVGRVKLKPGQRKKFVCNSTWQTCN